jgi:putative DNA primase/helicase
VKGPGCVHGDVLDLDAHAAGVQPAELLRRGGYLAALVDDTVERRVESVAQAKPTQQAIPGTVQSIEAGRLKGLSKSYASLCAILRNDKRIIAEPLEWNEMLCNPTMGGVTLEDEDVSRIREQIELKVTDSRGKSLQFRTGDIEQAVKQVASEHRFHPVREYLEDLEWDGTPRIQAVAEDVLSVEATELTQVLLRKWFISAVARPLEPGCQVDHVLILQGPQGPGKSTFFRTLIGDDWFTDQTFDLASDDGSRMVRKFWVIEWAELESMHRARSSGLVKSFITRRVDTFRPPYGRRFVDAKRHCVIVGTVNPEHFLSDPTGNRRFWPVAVGNHAFNLELLAQWRDQLWAEAVAAYRAKEAWYLDEKYASMLGESQEQFEEQHPWQSLVEEWLRSWTAEVTSAAVLEKAIKKHPGQWTRGDEMAVGQVMRALGYERQRRRGDKGERQYFWQLRPYRPNLSPPQNDKVGT